VSNTENPDAGKQPQQDRKVQPMQPPQDGDKKPGQSMPGRKGDLDQQDDRGTGGKPNSKDMKKDGKQDDAELDDENKPSSEN
jgi:hypothetical protein